MALSKNIKINILYFNSEPNIQVLNKIDNTVSNQLAKTITVPNAYIKITNLQGDKTNICIVVSSYDKKDDNLIKSDYYNFVPSVTDTAPNFIKQGYEYLKTLDEYKDAIDLLDEGEIATQ